VGSRLAAAENRGWEMSEHSVAVDLGMAGGPEGLSAMELLGFAGLDLIGAVVAVSVARYYLRGLRPFAAIAGALGLRDG